MTVGRRKCFVSFHRYMYFTCILYMIFNYITFRKNKFSLLERKQHEFRSESFQLWLWIPCSRVTYTVFREPKKVPYNIQLPNMMSHRHRNCRSYVIRKLLEDTHTGGKKLCWFVGRFFHTLKVRLSHHSTHSMHMALEICNSII